MKKQENLQEICDRPEQESHNRTCISEWEKRTDLAELPYGPPKKWIEYVRRTMPPPPALPTFLGSLGALGDAFIGALQVYWGFIRGGTEIYAAGRPPAEWDEFERSLGRLFACLLVCLAGLPREKERKDFFSLILEGLRLKNQRGRPQIEPNKLADMMHGRQMDVLRDSELGEAWNAKASLEGAGQNPRGHLEKKFKPDVVQAVLARKATPQSSLAWLYARRNNISVGRARNALRTYQKEMSKVFGPQRIRT